ncbi:hypothetical protein BC828DRAFT_395820 [Blastocladiella britannica]|nr:hypothetical protein BC828DRAFT_395820 [Blastocladiella britannica]
MAQAEAATAQDSLESPKFAPAEHPLDAVPALQPVATLLTRQAAIVDSAMDHLASRHTPLSSPATTPRASAAALRRRALADVAESSLALPASPTSSLAVLTSPLPISASFVGAHHHGDVEEDAMVVDTDPSSVPMPLSPEAYLSSTVPGGMMMDVDWFAAEDGGSSLMAPAAESPLVGHLSSSAPSTYFDDKELVDMGEAFLFGLNHLPRDPKRAFQCFLEVAVGGTDESAVAKANGLVGLQYEFGLGVEQSFQNCEPYYVAAGTAGHALSQQRMSFLRRYGRPHVRMNRTDAEMWHSRVDKSLSADAPVRACNAPSKYDSNPRINPATGRVCPLAWLWWAASQVRDPSAQYTLGTCYHDGIGVEKSAEVAFEWYHKSSDQGSPRGMGILGYCFGEGFGVERDAPKAIELYMRAAEAGETVAMYNVGYCYEEGIGVEESINLAFIWYKKSAEAGNALAANSLGYFYEEAKGLADLNLAEAVKWYRFSAEQGNPWAEHNLAYMYANGLGVDKDHAIAFEWYCRSAEQGHSGAQNKLGHCYQSGQGVAQDHVKAIEWYQRSADQGYSSSLVALAWMFDHGQGCGRDTRKALKALDRALELDHNDPSIADWYIALAREVMQYEVADRVRASIACVSAAPAA